MEGGWEKGDSGIIEEGVKLFIGYRWSFFFRAGFVPREIRGEH